MPGFLIFSEFGLDDIDPNMPDIQRSAMKMALGMMPGSWMMHGLGGEHNVNIDPVAEINKTLNGGGILGRNVANAQGIAEGAATGDVVAVAEGVAAGVGQFWEAYKGWIPVRSIEQKFDSEAEAERRDLAGEVARHNQMMAQIAAETATRVARQEVDQKVSQKTHDYLSEALPDAQIPPPKPTGSSTGGATWKTGMSGSTQGVERLSVEVHVDVSFPKLLKAALKPEGPMNGPRIFPSAEVHLCTTAGVDTRQITLRNDSPAAQLIQTLIGFFLFNVVPYLTISMKEVQVAEVRYDLQADSEGVPTATVVLEYKEIKWSYHVINGSNMNLYTVDFSYDVRNRKAPKGGLSLGSMLNPFA